METINKIFNVIVGIGLVVWVITVFACTLCDEDEKEKLRKFVKTNTLMSRIARSLFWIGFLVFITKLPLIMGWVV